MADRKEYFAYSEPRIATLKTKIERTEMDDQKTGDPGTFCTISYRIVVRYGVVESPANDPAKSRDNIPCRDG